MKRSRVRADGGYPIATLHPLIILKVQIISMKIAAWTLARRAGP
jgi:hypothetical protein